MGLYTYYVRIWWGEDFLFFLLFASPEYLPDRGALVALCKNITVIFQYRGFITLEKVLEQQMKLIQLSRPL